MREVVVVSFRRRVRGVALALTFLSISAFAVDEGLGPPPVAVDRHTPLATVQGFNLACHEGDYARAAFYLWLDHLPAAQQRVDGPLLARRLRLVLNRELPLDLLTLSRDPSPATEYVVLGAIPLGRLNQPVRLQHTASGWVFSEDTVRAIDRLFEQHGPPFAELLPEVMYRRTYAGLELWQWLGLLTALVLAIALAFAIERLAVAVGTRVTVLTHFEWDDALVKTAKGPLKLPVFAAVLWGGAQLLALPEGAESAVELVARSVAIVSVGWFLLRGLNLTTAILEGRVAKEQGDTGRAVRTQVAVLRRVTEIVIWFVSAALLLLQFNVVRNVGVSLLASAGIATLVIGLAAQKSIGNLVAGLQLSITQPVRIGDQVVVEGESGTVEEITLTYVVVEIWDGRRMVVPINYFLERPFQNWSKGAAASLGTFTFEADFTADVEAFRAELKRVLEREGRALWDGRVQKVQVVGAGDRTMSIRVLVSARNPDDNFDLRAVLRERLLAYLATKPEWLPRTRSAASPSPSGRGSG